MEPGWWSSASLQLQSDMRQLNFIQIGPPKGIEVRDFNRFLLIFIDFLLILIDFYCFFIEFYIKISILIVFLSILIVFLYFFIDF